MQPWEQLVCNVGKYHFATKKKQLRNILLGFCTAEKSFFKFENKTNAPLFFFCKPENKQFGTLKTIVQIWSQTICTIENNLQIWKQTLTICAPLETKFSSNENKRFDTFDEQSCIEKTFRKNMFRMLDKILRVTKFVNLKTNVLQHAPIFKKQLQCSNLSWTDLVALRWKTNNIFCASLSWLRPEFQLQGHCRACIFPLHTWLSPDQATAMGSF